MMMAYLGLFFFLLVFLYLPLAVIGVAPSPWNPTPACLPGPNKKIQNLSGYDFEIAKTDCSGPGGAISVSVFVAKAGSSRQELLFKYDPAYLDMWPSIEVPDPQEISISIPSVSSIFSRRYKWGDVRIFYNIGEIDYPDPEPKNAE
jgi:hypothetical protein